MRKGLANSFRFQMVLSVFGVFSLLVLSMTYILLSTIKLQSLADDGFKQERHLKSVQEALESYQQPLLEYLSTRSSNALAKLLVESQRLSSMIPDGAAASGSRSDLRERETYALIRAYLDLSEEAVSEKRGRNVDGYIGVYDRMNELLKHIETEMEIISTDRFRGQLDNYDRFISASRNVQLWNLLFILSISLFSVCLFLRSVEKMTDPMVRLSAMATELSEGNFGIDDIKLSSVYEIDHVVEAFNRMKHEMRSYIDEIRWQESIKQEYMQERVRNLKMEGLVRRMEIYTMQAQMNPHFLFNTLNTGMQLAIVEGADRTCEYMEYLSALFRHNVRSKDVIVPLRHEIEGLEYYFYILRVRFPKNLDLSLDCPEELLDACRVPASLLQPLVENCIVHAFKAQRGRSSIAVSGRLAQGRLELAVEDNGSGMEEETIAELLHPIDFEQDSPRVMGLGNVVQRLYFFYPGDPGVIRIESAIGGGTRVAISIDLGREPCIAS